MLSGNVKDIENIMPYLEERLKKALEYIQKTDFSVVENGEYEIDGRNIFVRINTYETEAKETKRPESHNKYIDVQFLGYGTEAIWYISKNEEQKIVEDRAESDDLLFYEDAGEKNCVALGAGDFAVFFPWELHRPGCMIEGPEKVQKIVVKVLAEKK